MVASRLSGKFVLLLLLCIFSGGLVLPRAYLGVVLPPYTLCFDGVSVSSQVLTGPHPFPPHFPALESHAYTLSHLSLTRALIPLHHRQTATPHNRPPHHHGPFPTKKRPPAPSLLSDILKRG